MPLLRSAYANGDADLSFAAIRLLSCLLMVFVPAAALGATFPLAIRWFADDSADPARRTGLLYAVTQLARAIGALVAGFILIPSLGLRATISVGIAASLAILCALGLLRFEQSSAHAGTIGAAASPKRVKSLTRAVRET
jgi:spermidine synthase